MTQRPNDSASAPNPLPMPSSPIDPAHRCSQPPRIAVRSREPVRSHNASIAASTDTFRDTIQQEDAIRRAHPNTHTRRYQADAGRGLRNSHSCCSESGSVLQRWPADSFCAVMTTIHGPPSWPSRSPC
ncbi:hypothetical protein C8Q76DRAFT_703108 [Earliella scabrosa]|nr:hypothetical protein C8Q76DRAFT_703108 [Earliella scabrosa]